MRHAGRAKLCRVEQTARRPMEASRALPGADDELQIRRFDPSTIKPHRIVVVVGKRGTGKSVLLRDLLYHAREKLDYGVAMSPTHETARASGRSCPRRAYQEYSQPIVEKLIDHQKTSGQHPRRGQAAVAVPGARRLPVRPEGAQVQADTRALYERAAHARFMMLAAQYMMDLSPALRTQVDYCICLRENIHANRGSCTSSSLVSSPSTRCSAGCWTRAPPTTSAS